MAKKRGPIKPLDSLVFSILRRVFGLFDETDSRNEKDQSQNPVNGERFDVANFAARVHKDISRIDKTDDAQNGQYRSENSFQVHG